MNIKSIKHIIPSIVIGGISIILVFLLHFLGVFDSMELKLVDFRFNFRGPILDDKKESFTNKDVVIVEIDDESFRLIPDPIPYGRGTVWNRVVKNLTDAKARVIVIDAMFDKPDHQTKNISSYLESNNADFPIKDGDEVFLKSIKYAEKNGTRVILSGKRAIEENRIPPDYILKPTKNLIDNEIKPKMGLVNIGPDSDGFIRRYPIFLPVSGDTNLYYTLAIEAVLAFHNYEGDKKLHLDGDQRLASIGPLNIKTYGRSNMFQINYAGPISSVFNIFPRYPLSNILDTEDYNIGDKDEDGNRLEDINWMGNYIDESNPLYFLFSQNNPFKDKIVVIGSSLSEDQDIHPTPYLNYNDNGSYQMSGAEIHANVIQQLLDKNFISTPIGNLEYDSGHKFIHILLILFFVTLTLLLVTKPEPLFELIIIILLISTWLSYSMGAFFSDYFWLIKSIINFFGAEISINIPELGSSELLPVIFPIVSMVVPFSFNLSYKLFKEGQDKKFLKDTFGNYISSELVDQMYESKEIPELGGEEGYHSLIYSDIASFSSFSEKLSPTQLVELLNEYLTGMTDIILNNRGTVDKYIGDAIMAFYGAPVKLKNHEEMAVQSVIQMNKKLEELREKWNSEGDKWPDLVKNMQHRIGIIAGNMQTGNMGSELQMNYTCMGDTVNTGARLESGAKHWGIVVQVSESIYIKTKDNYVYRKLGGIRVKGKKESITSYELICDNNEGTDKIKKMIELFEKAQNLYLEQKWDKAITMFNKSNEYEDMFEGRKINPSLTYISICKEFKEESPGDDWDGVYTFKQK